MPIGDMPHFPAVRKLLLQHPKRRRLFECIVARPGLHARRLTRHLGMALGIVEHHLRQLEKHALVFAYQHGRRRTYYATGCVHADDAPLIHALRKRPWGDMLALLAEHGPCSVAGLALWLEMPSSTVGHHLRGLKRANQVHHVRVGRDSYYTAIHATRLAELVAQLHPEAQGGVPDSNFAGLLGRAREHAGGSAIKPTIDLVIAND